nr:hypothetical protein [Tanacetum cinerariifolium]
MWHGNRLLYREELSILRGRKSVPGINSRERGYGKKRTTLSSWEGESDDSVSRGVGVGRRGLLPLSLKCTIGGALNAANEEPISAAPTNITTAQPKQQEAKEIKRNLEIVFDDEDGVFVNVTPLSSKPPAIMDYKIYKEGKKDHFQIIKANGNHHMYLAFSITLKNFVREDLKLLWKIVKDRFKESQPKEVLDVFLWHTLKMMFEHTVKDNL